MNRGANHYKGGCLCGSVAYSLIGKIRNIVNCHCGTCRRAHGAYGAYTRVQKSNLIINNSNDLSWYKSSTYVRRGFCKNCGSHLFWEPTRQPYISIVAGTLENSHNLKTIAHIFTSEKAKFYEIHDDIIKYEQSASTSANGL